MTYNFLVHFKKLSSIIVGLSATPIRNLKSNHNYEILKTIYGENDDINIISSYENITAIIDKSILNIEIFWFEANLEGKTIINRNNDVNINNLINCIKNVMRYLPNKKIMVWCGTIQHAKKIYDTIMSDKDLKNIFCENIFIDHSQISNNTVYKQFNPLTKNTIIICADKYREGTDIKYMDCIIFADLVKKKSELPFIQCVGRVQRKGYNKTVGYVIDHYDITCENNFKIKDIINKLIGYYYEFFSYTNKFSNKLDNAIKMYEDILKRYTFEQTENGNIINIKLTNDLSIKIHTGLSNIHFDDIKHNFKPIIYEHIEKEFDLSEQQILKKEYETFKITNNEFLFIEDKNEYENRINDFNLEKDPINKYSKIWNGWYDYLGIDTSTFPKTKKNWVDECKKMNIKNKTDYLNKIKNIRNMPKMPEEFYKLNNIFSTFNDPTEL